VVQDAKEENALIFEDGAGSQAQLLQMILMMMMVTTTMINKGKD
jgi:hypothetical protein